MRTGPNERAQSRGARACARGRATERGLAGEGEEGPTPTARALAGPPKPSIGARARGGEARREERRSRRMRDRSCARTRSKVKRRRVRRDGRCARADAQGAHLYPLSLSVDRGVDRGRPESGRSGAAVMVTAMGRACYPYTYTMTYPGRRRRLARDRERTGRAGRLRPHPHPRCWVGIVNRDAKSVRGVCCVWSDFVGENAPVPSCEEESKEERGVTEGASALDGARPRRGRVSQGGVFVTNVARTCTCPFPR